MCVPMWVSAYHMLAHTCEGQQLAWIPWNELQVVVSCLAWVLGMNWVCYKSSECSQPLSYFSRPVNYIKEKWMLSLELSPQWLGSLPSVKTVGPGEARQYSQPCILWTSWLADSGMPWGLWLAAWVSGLVGTLVVIWFYLNLGNFHRLWNLIQLGLITNK